MVLGIARMAEGVIIKHRPRPDLRRGETRTMKITRKAFESELNEIGPAVHELMLLGGRVPAVMADRYGTWLRRHDSTAFNVALNKEQREG